MVLDDRSALNEKKCESSEDILDRFQEAVFKDWNDGQSLEKLAKGYLELKIKVHVHCRLVIFGSWHTQEFCALFQGQSPRRKSLEGSLRFREKPVGIPPLVTGINEMRASRNCYEKSVFVYDIESMEPPEYIAFPSLVRLKNLDGLDHFGPGARYFSCNLGFNVGGSVNDRECGTLVGRSTPSEAQLPSEIIETRAQVMDSVPQDEQQALGAFFRDVQDSEAVARLGIVVSENAIGVTIQEGPKFCLEVLDVLFGPVNLSPNQG